VRPNPDPLLAVRCACRGCDCAPCCVDLLCALGDRLSLDTASAYREVRKPLLSPRMSSAAETPAQAAALPPAPPPKTRDEINIDIARKMFIGGCLLLPWLWVLNVILYRRSLFDPAAPAQLKYCTFRVPH
jgi:hypothetical protein